MSGKAGSGKSTVLKFLAHRQRVREEVESWASPKKLVFIVTFFWNSGDTMQMSLEGFYRSIIFEILKQCPDLLQDVFPAFDDHQYAQLS
jgi:cytidylate kinase